jgi:SAM-dependent methyltransferase
VRLTRELLAALRTPSGAALLDEASRRGVTDPLPTITALRAAGHPHELVAAAVEQAVLRDRAVAKFGIEAAGMFFTPDGLEQATRSSVAAHRATRFSGLDEVLDLCCGIGGDLTALARTGASVVGVERDPVTAAVAAANTSGLGVSVTCADATSVPLTGAVFCDPARRSDGRRIFDPSAYSPPWSFLEGLLASGRPTGVKVAPGIDHALVPDGCEAEWVSDGGDVKEAALWSPELATAARRATLLPAEATLTGSGLELVSTGAVQEWFYDPDGAVVRSHLVAELAELLGAHGIDPTIAYLTSSSFAATPFAKAYRVLDVLPFSLKRLRGALRERRVGRVQILKRGSPVDVEKLRHDLHLAGDQDAAVVLTRVAGKPTAVICSPVSR